MQLVAGKVQKQDQQSKTLHLQVSGDGVQSAGGWWWRGGVTEGEGIRSFYLSYDHGREFVEALRTAKTCATFFYNTLIVDSLGP